MFVCSNMENTKIAVPTPKIAFLFLGLLTAGFSYAQSPSFRQQFTQRINTNPALLGMGNYEGKDYGRVGATSRAQWLSLEGRLFTQALSYDGKLNNTRASLGGSIIATDLYSGSGNNAKYSHFMGTLGYAYTLPTRKFNTQFGIALQYSNYSFGSGRYTWSDQVDPNFTGFVLPTQEPMATIVKNAFHVSAGALMYNKNFFFGGSVYNINQPDISIYPGNNMILKTKINIQGGVNLYSKIPGLIFTPHLYLMKQGTTSAGTVALNVKLDNLQFGLGVQGSQFSDPINNTKASNVGLTNYVGFHYGKLNLGYSIDWNLTYGNGQLPITHEISLGILTHQTTAKSQLHRVRLPEF